MEYGCIGERLGHSFSAQIHPKFFDYKYELCEVSRENIDAFMKAKDFKGINVTIPYKQTVIKYLDEIDFAAKEIGAVNTIVNKNGKLSGYNTDFYGLKALIERNVDLKGKKVLILGSGGTSKTAEYVCKALGCKQVFRLSRSEGEGVITYETAYETHADCDVIINTTPVGMYPDINKSVIDLSKFKRLSCVIDAVYNPLCSKLVLEAKARGIRAEGGLYMLVCQAARAAELFMDAHVAEDKIQKVFCDIYKAKQNIVLIGMPTSGKTSVGAVLSKALSRECFDSDSLIEQLENTDIPTIFKTKGEPYFRNLETKAVAQLSAFSGVIIATGGGVILNKENIELLRANGRIYFLDRPLESLLAANDRPLSSNKADLEKRYNERYNLYNAYADVKVAADGTVQEVAQIIKEDFLG